MELTEQAIERLDTLVQQNGELIQQNSSLTDILSVCDINAEERALGKKRIVEAIIKMGGNASEDDSLFALAIAIKRLKTLNHRTIVTDDLPRPINLGTYICAPSLLKDKIIHAYSEDAISISKTTFASSKTLLSIDMPNATSACDRAFSSSSVKSINLPKIKSIGGNVFEVLKLDFLDIHSVESNDRYIFMLASVKGGINMPNLTTLSGLNSQFQLCDTPEILLPNVITMSGYQKFINSTVRVLDLTNVSNVFTTGNLSDLNGTTNLIDLRIGKNILFDFNLEGASYNPSVAYSTTSASLVDAGEPFSTNNQKWNYNLREHFAANLQDRTGLDAFTITFGGTVLAQMEEATIEAFTSKNWTLA